MPKAFEAEEKSLEALMRGDSGNSAYVIPLYQRRYVWGNEENSKLWDDVKECYARTSNHFLGSLVLMKYERDEYAQKYQADELCDKLGAENVFHVVDGQQRLTSLSLVLAALYHDMIDHDVFYKELPDCDVQDKQDWDDLKSRMRACLVVTMVRDRDSKTGKGYIPRIVPVKSIYEEYKGIVNTNDHGKKLRIDRAYMLYVDRIRELREEVLPSSNPDIIDPNKDRAADVYDFYYNLFNAITNRMKIIRIVCGADEDAFQVFESLNGTGLRLTASDRIKNLLMGKATNEGSMAISKVEAEWNTIETLASGSTGGSSDTEAFFTSYMFVITGRRVAKKELTKEFTSKYLPNFANVRLALNDLKKAADFYGTIVHTDTEYIDSDGDSKSLSPKLKAILSGISKNNPSQSIVPLLAAAMGLPKGLDDPDFERIAQALLVLLVRHKVCQLSTNMLDKFFEAFCLNMKEGDVSAALVSLRNNTKDDQYFYSEFARMTFDMQNRVDVIRARYYLQMIENYLRTQQGNDNLNPDVEYTLEHIIPQDYEPDTWFKNHPEETKLFDENESYRMIFDDTIVQSIGNMCLLRRPENSSASNAVFEVKLQRYQQADDEGKTARETFQLVNQIVSNRMRTDDETITIVEPNETFGPKAVERRAGVLATYALKVWKR